MDWVSIVTFDTTARIQQTLTSNYSTAMTACTGLQACSDTALCTDTEGGLITAYNLIKPQSQGGQGRENTNKIVVLLTDGQPNLQQSSNTTISQYINANPQHLHEPQHRPDNEQLVHQRQLLYRYERRLDADLDHAGRQLVSLSGGRGAELRLRPSWTTWPVWATRPITMAKHRAVVATQRYTRPS